MNGIEQRERATAVHRVEQTLTAKFEAVIDEFDKELERMVRQRAADQMSIVGIKAGLEERIEDLSRRIMTETSKETAARNTLAKEQRNYVDRADSALSTDFRHFRDGLTWWQRISWLLRGRF